MHIWTLKLKIFESTQHMPYHPSWRLWMKPPSSLAYPLVTLVPPQTFLLFATSMRSPCPWDLDLFHYFIGIQANWRIVVSSVEELSSLSNISVQHSFESDWLMHKVTWQSKQVWPFSKSMTHSHRNKSRLTVLADCLIYYLFIAGWGQWCLTLTGTNCLARCYYLAAASISNIVVSISLTSLWSLWWQINLTSVLTSGEVIATSELMIPAIGFSSLRISSPVRHLRFIGSTGAV